MHDSSNLARWFCEKPTPSGRATVGILGRSCKIGRIRRNLEDWRNLQDDFAKKLDPPGVRRLGFLEDLARLGEIEGTRKIGGTWKTILRKTRRRRAQHRDQDGPHSPEFSQVLAISCSCMFLHVLRRTCMIFEERYHCGI